MPEFKKLEICDIPMLRKFITLYPSRSSDKAVGSIMMWRNYFDNHYAVYDDTVVLSSMYAGGCSFTYPVGKAPNKLLDCIEEFCSEHHIKPVFCSLSSTQLELLKSRYADYTVEADRDWFDYIYKSEDLINLTGKKYAQQRNQIHKFVNDNLDWSFEKIDNSNLNEIKEFTREYEFHADKTGSLAVDELELCLEVLDNYDAFGLFGGVLRAGGKIVGYSIGEISGDTIFIHIEKADTAYRGCYQMLSNLFLKNFADDSVKFVNREEDCGDEGLRRSKLSYRPIYLLEKYTFYVK